MTSRSSAIPWLAAIFAWLCGAAVFFRTLWLSGLDRLSGQAIDGRLLAYLHEHLFNWLRGVASLASPGLFYPQPHVLSYSDALLLDLPTYALLRTAGADLFLSHQLMLILLALLGYVTFITVLRYAFAVRYTLAVAAALLFVFSNIMYLKQAHSQLFAVYYLPGIALLFLWSARNFPSLGLRLFGGISTTALLYGLLFSTSYYIAWGTALVVLVSAVFSGVVLRSELIAFCRRYRHALALAAFCALAGFAIGLIPFAIIYGPLIQAGARRDYIEALGFAPFPQDIFNVSPWNLAWGDLLSRLPDGAGLHFARWEAIAAVTPSVVIATAIGAWQVWRGRLIDWAREPVIAVFVTAVIFSYGVLWLLTWRIGTYSAFWLIWHFVPGASGIRAAGRLGLIVNMMMVAALAVLLDRWLSRAGERSPLAAKKAAVLISALLAFAGLEQINRFDVARISRTRELAALAAVPMPPGDCEAFFVEPARDSSPLELQAMQISAMLISQHIGLPTLNGGSGFSPQGWSLMQEASYHDNVRRWINLNHLRGRICSLTLPRGPWQSFAVSR